MEVKGNIYAAGIYGMRLKSSKEFTDYLYIGSSTEMNDAKSRHNSWMSKGSYANTNKLILQKEYNNNNLVFEVIRESQFSSVEVQKMNEKEKENLQKSLSSLEQMYINLYRDSCCNCQKSVTKHSSNHNEETTLKRKASNQGSNNPHCKYDEKMISNIIWLKENGYKVKDIEKIYADKGIKSAYICCLGITKWLHIEAIKPDFIA
jgi:hypothetical protein